MQPRSIYNAKGIDVSHHNGSVDWGLVKAYGYSFVFIKATEGTTFEDSKFHYNYKGGRKNNLLTGYYHFARPYNNPIEEADFFIETISKYNGFKKEDLPPVLDIEVNEGLNKIEVSKWVRIWINRVKEIKGIQPILYTNLNFAREYLDESLSDISLWLARYNTYIPEDVSGWNKWTFLQYTSQGLVPGIYGHVDLNEFNGTEQELKIFVLNSNKNLI